MNMIWIQFEYNLDTISARQDTNIIPGRIEIVYGRIIIVCRYDVFRLISIILRSRRLSR